MANLKLLLANEFRRQMPVLWSAIGVAFMLWLISAISGKVLPQRSSFIALYVSFLILCPILAAWSGALAFGGTARDLAKGPSLFAWSSKLVIACLFILLGLTLTCLASLRISFEHTSMIPEALVRESGFLFFPDSHHSWDLSFLLGIPVALITLGCAQLAAVLLDSVFASGFAGALAGMSISAAIIHCWLRMEMDPWRLELPLTFGNPGRPTRFHIYC